MRASYEADGTENLQANPSVYAAAGNSSPTAMGQDAGGDKVSHTLYSSPGKSQPGGSASTPDGVQSFDGAST